MSRYDEILQIFESQKHEISKLSDKVNELEETNAFLITILEKSKTLPPVYNPNLLRKDKAAAIQKEFTLKSNNEKISYIDSTHCETTLNESYEENLTVNNNPNSLRWSSDSSINKKLFSPNSKSESNCLKPFQNVSISDEASCKSFDKKCQLIESKPENNNLNLRVSNSSPIRRQSIKSIVLCNNEKINLSNECSSDNKTSNSEDESENENEQDFLDSVIVKSVNDLISEAENIPLSKINDKFNITSKVKNLSPTQMSPNQSLSFTNTAILRINDKDNIQVLLDNLIDTLQSTNKAISNQASIENLKSPDISKTNNSESIYSDYVNKLLVQKDQYLSNVKDKHTQMKLLLTAQQLQADLLHQSLEENNKIIFSNCNNITENISSNSELNPINKNTQAHVDEILQLDISKVPTLSTDIKLYRQQELSRINNKINDPILESPKIKNGFVKFTALIKGYIVRTLRETDKVQNIIITIKDTAHLAIKLRQERLSGDCSQNEDYNSYHLVTRRNNQEIISFQQRLVSQLKTALGELHEIFFEWPSSLQMRLIRHHIDQLMLSTSTNVQPKKENSFYNSSMINYSTKKAAKLSSATLKRRQKLALRSPNNIKENEFKNSNSSTAQRKPIYSSPYGCRGYGNGTHSRAANIQSKNAVDRKPRTNSISRRRGATRTITKFDIDKISSNSQSNSYTITNKPPKTVETNIASTIPAKPEQINHNHQQQQQQQQQQSQSQSQYTSKNLHSKSKPHLQSIPPPAPPEIQSQRCPQQWKQPKTITTSICSQNSNNLLPFDANFKKAQFIITQNRFNSNPADGDSIDNSTSSNKFSTSAYSTSAQCVPEANINYSDECDWKTQTYTLSNNNTIVDNNFNNDFPGFHSSKFTITDDTSSKSLLSDFNENSVSRVEVDINDLDIGYLCQNNSSHYNEYNDPTDSQNIVFVDDILHQDKEQDLNNTFPKPQFVLSHHPNSSTKSNKRNFSFQKHLIKPNVNNVVLSSALNQHSKPDFYLSVNSKDPVVSPSSSQFRIRKRIVAPNTLCFSTVSHS